MLQLPKQVWLGCPCATVGAMTMPLACHSPGSPQSICVLLGFQQPTAGRFALPIGVPRIHYTSDGRSAMQGALYVVHCSKTVVSSGSTAAVTYTYDELQQHF